MSLSPGSAYRLGFENDHDFYHYVQELIVRGAFMHDLYQPAFANAVIAFSIGGIPRAPATPHIIACIEFWATPYNDVHDLVFHGDAGALAKWKPTKPMEPINPFSDQVDHFDNATYPELLQNHVNRFSNAKPTQVGVILISKETVVEQGKDAVKCEISCFIQGGNPHLSQPCSGCSGKGGAIKLDLETWKRHYELHDPHHLPYGCPQGCEIMETVREDNFKKKFSKHWEDKHAKDLGQCPDYKKCRVSKLARG